jgi:hypothetical protein
LFIRLEYDKRKTNDFLLILGVPYNITVYTSNKSKAGTDARVYIIMHHNKSSSGQIFLSHGKFEQKSVDLITIDGPDDLSPLTALDIGHDNSGMGPGWHLDKVCLGRKKDFFTREAQV